MRESKSQRILDKFDTVQEYWEQKRDKLASLAGKESPNQGLLQDTNDFRKKVEQ